MNIVAIGGGEISQRETLAIDQAIVRLAQKTRPKALFIPTASGDASGYIDTFHDVYGNDLGCQTQSLLLFGQDRDAHAIKSKILEADIIYVGGGNTLRMMKLWRRRGVDQLLKRAGNQGAVMAGLSAGAICWHDFGHSDSCRFSRDGNWSYIRVKGLGFQSGVFCPHLDQEGRHEPFRDMIARQGGTGIACDDNAAIWYRSKKRPVVIASQKGATVRVYKRLNGKTEFEVFQNGDEIEL